MRLKDWLRIAGRELTIGIGPALILAAIGFARVLTWQAVFHSYGPNFFPLAITVFLSLIGVVLWGTISGAMLPLILKKVGLTRQGLRRPLLQLLWTLRGF